MGVAVAIVVAHNVYHWIPNEVPILLVLAVVSCRVREGHWGFGLYGRPSRDRWVRDWPRTLLVAAVGVALLLGKDWLVETLEAHFHAAPEHVSSVIAEPGGLGRALGTVAFVWVFAGFGEEIGYRGYLLRRALEAFGQSWWCSALALTVASAAFGLGHFYKGPWGMLDSAGSGLILGGAYLASRRLWASSLAHGAIDTLAVMLSYFGGM